MTNKENTKRHRHENPELAQADRERRRSGAATPWDNRPKRERSRQAVKRAEIARYAA